MHTRRLVGAALLGYLGFNIAAVATGNAPGGDFDNAQVASYVSADRMVAQFTSGYLGFAAAIALMVAAVTARDWLADSARHLPAALVARLFAAAATVTAAGWTVTAGVPVAFAEGSIHVSHQVVYLVSEIGVLLAVAMPAMLVGAALVLLPTQREALPGWLRVTAPVAGVCGIAAPFYFPMPVYLLWVLVAAITLLARPGLQARSVEVPLHTDPKTAARA